MCGFSRRLQRSEAREKRGERRSFLSRLKLSHSTHYKETMLTMTTTPESRTKQSNKVSLNYKSEREETQFRNDKISLGRILVLLVYFWVTKLKLQSVVRSLDEIGSCPSAWRVFFSSWSHLSSRSFISWISNDFFVCFLEAKSKIFVFVVLILYRQKYKRSRRSK